jgi:hypothetical protein
MASIDIDVLLEAMEQGVKKVDGSQGSRVKLQRAEKELLQHFGQARDMLESSLKHNRSRLQQDFGGPCDHIARLHAVLDAANLSPTSADDPRNYELRARCKSMENVLMVSGCGPSLQKSVLQHKESLWKKLTHMPLQIRIVKHWKHQASLGVVAAAAAEAALADTPRSAGSEDGPAPLAVAAAAADAKNSKSEEQLHADLEALSSVVVRIETAIARLLPAPPGQAPPLPSPPKFGDLQRVSSAGLIEQFAALEYAVTRVELAADLALSHSSVELEPLPSEADIRVLEHTLVRLESASALLAPAALGTTLPAPTVTDGTGLARFERLVQRLEANAAQRGL